MMGRGSLARWTIAAAAVALVPTVGFAAGFGIFEQGSKAMGMAGAFTAQADDGSAMFHNVAGLAFQKEGALTAGTTFITISDSTFEGADPFPGTGVTGEQDAGVLFPSHAYWVRPINSTWTFGFSLNTPFGLTTEWADVDDWAGRYLSYRAELRTFDLGFNLGWQATDNLGLGLGVVTRVSDVELNRRVPFINPFTFGVVDVADVTLSSDFDYAVGFTAGVLHHVTNSFAWGFSYRSKMTIDYSGDGRLASISTGFPQLDAAVAAALPLDQNLPIETSISFPDMASLGFSFAFTRNTRFEVDANWTGWSEFDVVNIVFTTASALNATLPQEWEDAYNYRAGFRWTAPSGNEWRLGYVFDETPQPDRGVSPLLPDADRNGFTVGYGWKGDRLVGDFALMYLPFDVRSTDVNRDNFNGTYDTTAWLFGATLTF